MNENDKNSQGGVNCKKEKEKRSENQDFEGVDFDSEQINFDDDNQFRRKYSERHRRVIRVSRPPEDGQPFRKAMIR